MSFKHLCNGKRILLLDCFCKQCLPFIRGFRELGCEISIVCSSKLDAGYASRLPHHKILSSLDWRSGEGTEDYILELAKSGKYDVFLPGLRVPQWNKVLETVKKAALMIPDFGHIAWDIAVSESDVTLIEANEQGNFNLIQCAGGRGYKKDYLRVINGDTGGLMIL